MAYCRNCGHPLDPSIKHCPKCGSANPEYAKPKKKGAGNLLFFLLGIVLSAGILAGVIAAGWLTIGNTIGKKENKASKVEGAGYNTPEEAVKAYAQYLKAGDLDGLLSTCAIESYASHLRAEIYYEMYSGFMANSSLPPGTDLRNRIDAEQQRESFIKSLRDAYVNYAIRGTEYEEQMNSTHMLMIQEGETGRFIEIMSNEIPFDSMEIGETIPFETFVETRENYVVVIARYLNFLGAQDIRPMLLQVTFRGEPYILATTTVCYEGKWYNLLPRVIYSGIQEHIAPLGKWQSFR